MGGKLHRGGDLAVEKDDAVPRLLGRGHSSTALIHGKGQVRTWSNTPPQAIIRTEDYTFHNACVFLLQLCIPVIF